MQPVWLCIIWPKPFKETYKNTQWRKVLQVQLVWQYIHSGKQSEEAFKYTQGRKLSFGWMYPKSQVGYFPKQIHCSPSIKYTTYLACSKLEDSVRNVTYLYVITTSFVKWLKNSKLKHWNQDRIYLLSVWGRANLESRAGAAKHISLNLTFQFNLQPNRYYNPIRSSLQLFKLHLSYIQNLFKCWI